MLTNQPPESVSSGVIARQIIRASAMAAIATLDADTGAPYASLVNVATAMDGAPLALMSKLAQHRQNIQADARVSLVFDATQGHEDPLAGARASVMGTAAITERAADMRRFRARHPGAFYADFADFSCFRIEPEKNHLVAGFGKIEWLGHDQVVLGRELTGSLEEDEPEILSHINRDQSRAVMLIAPMLLGAEPARWEMVAIDPEGVDIAAAARHLRLEFDAPVSSKSQALEALTRLTRDARARGDA